MLVASSPCSDFLCASMGSSWYRRFLATGVAGGNGAIGNLDSKALGETTIAIPNDAEIDKLGNFFTRLDSLITLHQREPPHTMKEGKNANRYQWRIAFLRLLLAMD